MDVKVSGTDVRALGVELADALILQDGQHHVRLQQQIRIQIQIQIQIQMDR